MGMEKVEATKGVCECMRRWGIFFGTVYTASTQLKYVLFFLPNQNCKMKQIKATAHLSVFHPQRVT